jgi:HK97 family phage portal protein
MGLLSRIFKPSVERSVEGEWRPGPYPTSAGWIPDGAAWNWWQQGYDPLPSFDRLAIVEACLSAYAQTIAMCPGNHWRATSKGGRERVTNSALSRILRKPNPYQTISDFKLNLVRSLYTNGNAYALAFRNDRFEITELHLMDPNASRPRVAYEGELFYTLGGNEIIERQLGVTSTFSPLGLVPARDVLHIKLNTQRNPMIGESPLLSAAFDLAQAKVIGAQQLAFYRNQARPSFLLGTDAVLTPEQIQQARTLWDEHSKGLNQGKTPILAAGLKPIPLHVTAEDAQLIEQLKLSTEHIALAFRVPLQLLGIGGTPFASTELLMQSWINLGLGFALNHVEQAFDRLFGLVGEPIEYSEFDTDALLRSAMKDRVEALARGVQGGIYAPNEARRLEGLPDVEFGDEPRVQQQVVPLSAASAIPSAPSAPPAEPQAAPTNLGNANGGRGLRELVRARRVAA